MAASLDPTVGGSASNTYGTLAEADAYHDEHVAGLTWEDADEDTKLRALITATRQIDSLIAWSGSAASTTQALAWPRTGMLDPISGAVIASTTIPTALKHAQFEQARALLAGDRAEELAQQVQGLTGLVAGPVELTFSENAPKRVVLVSSALALIQAWGRLQQPGATTSVPLVRV